MKMNPKNSTVGQSWIWGGSLMELMLAVETRQATLGVLPMAVILPLWQRQQIQMIENQYSQKQSRLQQEFQSLQQDCLTSLASGHHLPSQDEQDLLLALRDQMGSLHKQVQQLQTILGQTQTQVAQVKDSQGSLQGQLHSLGDHIHQTQAHLDQMCDAMQLDTAAMKQLTAVRQQLSLVKQDVQVLKLANVQDLELCQDVEHLRHELVQMTQAQDKQPQRKPVGVFIDGANINHSARDRGISLDYPQLVDQLVGRDPHPDVFFYSGYDPDNFAQQQLKRDLRDAGFTVKMQPVTHRADGSSKANMDGQMIVDMLLEHYDRVVLLSGDGDFFPALSALRDQGSKVEVAAFSRDTHGSLKTFRYVDLTTLLQPDAQGTGYPVLDLPLKQRPATRQQG